MENSRNRTGVREKSHPHRLRDKKTKEVLQQTGQVEQHKCRKKKRIFLARWEISGFSKAE